MSKRKTVRRRTSTVKTSAAAKKKPPKKRNSPKPSLNSQSKMEMEIYKHPHTMVTTHPKIPDGKVPRSLGLSNQSAGELTASLTTQPGGQPGNAAGVMHILIFPGQNSGALIYGSTGSYTTSTGTNFNNALAPGESIFWEGSPDLSFGSVTSTTGGTISTTFEYASWRNVSQGLSLGLLNPAESDDGWWEMVRVTDTLDPEDYQVRNRVDTDTTAYGTVAPQGKLTNDLLTRNLGNNNSYRTGLLRDIHKEYFQLLPSYKDHDFLQQMDEQAFTGDDIQSVMNAGGEENGRYVRFNNTDDSRNFINSKVDPSFDMIYLRIHGRTSGEATRLHYNMCANHEVTYSARDIEGRFMTPTVNDSAGVSKAKQSLHDGERKKSSKIHRPPKDKNV